MVPDKFDMVDMGGIDLILMQGEEVPGLHNRLVESITQCHYQCLYNWLFDGVVIPPTYVEMEVNEDDEVVINEGVTVTPDDVMHIYSIEPTPIEPVINPISIVENGTYYVPEGVDGFNPVTVDIATGVPLLAESQWNALPVQQKRSYGLVAIQDAIEGYVRGKLVNGADYIGGILQSGTGSASISDTINFSGELTLVVLALNGEASTYQLNIDAKINGSSVTGETIIFNNYSGSGTNRRNYRLNQYSVNVNSGDGITIEITNRGTHSAFVWAIMDTGVLTLDKAVSVPDNRASGSNTNSGFVLKGTFNNNTSGTIALEQYFAEDTVTTENPGTSYKSAYIFWFI